jgi:hypothetical protein
MLTKRSTTLGTDLVESTCITLLIYDCGKIIIRQLPVVEISFFTEVKEKKTSSIPGHGSKQLKTSSVAFPLHAFPPFWGGGELHRLVLVITTPGERPQGLGQSDQCDHGPHPPSCGPAENNEMWLFSVGKNKYHAAMYHSIPYMHYHTIY